jgi:hypothetical protein
LKLLRIYSRRWGDHLLLPVFLLFILIYTPLAFTQENFPIGSRAAALANAVVMDTGIWSVSHNQAGLGDYHYLSIGFHNENKYVIPEAALHALALTLPVRLGTFGLSYTYFGYSKYNENKIGLGFGKKLGPKLSAGIQLNYHYVFVIEEYESRHAVTVEGGIQYKPIPTIRMGLHLFNPSRSHLSPTNMDTLSTTLRAGISYSPFKKLWMAVETEKSLDYNLRIKSGIEYEIYDGLYLRTGIITHPVQNTFGLGFNIKRINADVAFSHDPILGFTPHFSFDVRLK